MEELRRYGLLGTPPEQALDDLTSLAARLCGAPMALISLMDVGRLWFKSKFGLAACETPREFSPCACAMGQQGLFVVPDAAKDERFAGNPLVAGEPGVRFYAGAPLVTPAGHALGTLCVMDVEPRQLSALQEEALRVLGRQVMAQFELRRQTRELAAREARLRAIIDSEPECVKLLAADGSLLEMNPAGLRMLEADSFAQVENRCVYPLVDGEYRRAFRELNEKVFAGGSGTLEFEIVGLKGGRRWLETHATPLRDEFGGVTALLGITRDVTGRKQAEAARRESERRMREMLEHVELIAVMLDTAGRVTFCNDFLLQLTGWTRAEALGSDWFERFVPPGSDRVRRMFAEALRGGEIPTHFENEIMTKAGARRVVRWSNTLARDPSGAVTGATSIGEDVTARQQAEAALRESEEKFRNIFNASPVPCALNDDRQNITFLNPEFTRTFGYGLADIPTLAEWWPRAYPDPAYRSWVQAAWQARLGDASKNNTPFEPLELKVACKDGAERIVVATAARLGESFAGTHLVTLFDITNLKQAEVALRESEELFSTAFRSSPVGLRVATLEGRFVEVNRTLCEQFGYAREEFIGRTAVELGLVNAAYREKMMAAVAPDGTADELELHVRRRDGKTIVLLVSQQPVSFKGVPHILSTSVEITERKQAEARVHALNRVYSLLSEINQVIAREKDSPAMLAAACRIAVAKGGFSLAWIGLAETPGGRLQISAHAGADAGALEILNRMLDAEPPAGCAFTRHALEAGERRICDDIANDPLAAPWREAALERQCRAMGAFPLKVEGRVVGVLNLYASEAQYFDEAELRLLDELSADISFALEVHGRELRRQRAEQDLRASEERFRQVVENIQEVFWVADPAKREMLYVSPAYETIWGRPCASFGKSPESWLEAVHPEDRERVEMAAKSKQAGGGYDEMYRILRPDGSARWIHDRAFPVRNAAGEVHLVVGVAEDVTTRKHAEQLALRSQRLESIGTLAGGVAHDLNNALAPILMGVDMLRMEYPRGSETLDLVQASAKRGAAMVRQLLNFAKGAEGQRVAIQPGRLVKEMEKFMLGTFPKNIQVVVKLDPALPLVLGDATQLQQVVLNLSVNARDAMPQGGVLTLEERRVELDAAQASTILGARPGNYVVLQVSDTGVGIPAAIIDRIFDPFFTTKSPDKGTGVGLSTVMGIVRGHGGFMRVQSQPGQGSTFTAYLPAAGPGIQPEQAAPPPQALPGRGELILYVDDEEALRRMADAVLRRMNFNVLTAADGADGLRQASSRAGELRAVITDLHMPRMDGLAFVREIRRILPSLPVIVSSGRMEDADQAELMALKVDVFLGKPFTEAELARALKQLLAPK